MIEPGHLARVRLSIVSGDEYPKPTYGISALMRCGDRVSALLGSKSIGAKWEGDLALLGLATKFDKRVRKHLKGCKTCRIAKRKSTSRSA